MKIAILGYAGSGKSYLTNYISKSKQIPALHLDEISYNKNWEAYDKQSVLPQVAEFMEQDSWVIDGNYDHLYFDKRLSDAGLIIFVVLPRLTCFFRCLKRKKQREAEGYVNDMNPWFIRFILFGCRSKERRQQYSQIMKQYKEKVIVLKSKKQVDKFIEALDEYIKK